MRTPFRASCLLLGLVMSAGALAKSVRPARPEPKPTAAPEAAEPRWELDKGKELFTLAYGGPEKGENVIVSFTCMPRHGDITIHLPELTRRAKPDETQLVAFTIAGVKSSFAGQVVEDENGGLELAVVVTARNPMFTSLAGPGSMRIEGKGFNKLVPLKTLGAKVRDFAAACRRP